MDQGPSDQKKQKPSDSILRFSGLGIQMMLTIGLSAWGGYALDRYLGLKFPAFLVSFVFLSFGASMYLLYKQLNNNSER